MNEDTTQEPSTTSVDEMVTEMIDHIIRIRGLALRIDAAISDAIKGTDFPAPLASIAKIVGGTASENTDQEILERIRTLKDQVAAWVKMTDAERSAIRKMINRDQIQTAQGILRNYIKRITTTQKLDFRDKNPPQVEQPYINIPGSSPYWLIEEGSPELWETPQTTPWYSHSTTGISTVSGYTYLGQLGDYSK